MFSAEYVVTVNHIGLENMHGFRMNAGNATRQKKITTHIMFHCNRQPTAKNKIEENDENRLNYNQITSQEQKHVSSDAQMHSALKQ